MSGKLGLEMPLTERRRRQLRPLQLRRPDDRDPPGLHDAALAAVGEDGTQIWKITHNGVDTHPIHFHLFDVQVINRVGWDGAIRPPDDNELGWKDTVRISPLEDTIVALRPVAPKMPFGLPGQRPAAQPGHAASARPWASRASTRSPASRSPPRSPTRSINFGWEYVWHCHILSHEEMDMMRPMSLVCRTVPAGQSVPRGDRRSGRPDRPEMDRPHAG